jgi:hypothetical protein
MSSSKYRQRVADHPRSLPGAVGGIAVTIGLVVALRIGVGLAINDPVHPVTYLAVFGGGLGAVAMFVFVQQTGDGSRFAPIDFWAERIGDGDVAEYQRQGLYLHVTYGAILAGFYPRILIELTGSGTLFAALPLSLVTGTIFGVILFVLGIVYARIGLFGLGFEPPVVFRFLTSHVVFGLVLGLVTGLMKPVIRPLLGF